MWYFFEAILLKTFCQKWGVWGKKDKQRRWPYKGVVYIRGVKPVHYVMVLHQKASKGAISMK